MREPGQHQCSGENAADRAERQEALRHLMDAWEGAILDGVSPDAMANAALFAALSDLVSTYGEEAVTRLAATLPGRIEHGEFTLDRTRQ